VNTCNEYLGAEFVLVILNDDYIPRVDAALRRMDIATIIIHQFDNLTEGVNIENSLIDLLTMEKKKSPIVINNRVGVRVVDFRFKDVAHVIIGFLPDTMAVFI
jgi:hypothetical protein